MTITIRFAFLAVVICCLARTPSHADDTPRAYAEGYRCGVVEFGETPVGSPNYVVYSCQIADDGNPTGTDGDPRADPSTPFALLDSLLQLLTLLEHTLQLSITAPGPEAPHTP